jgi:pimeloyl-ACP methyl ester carboxylesterase
MKRLPALLSDPDVNLPKAVNGFLGMLRRRSPIYYLNDGASSASADRWARLAADQSDWGTSINFPFPQIGEAYGVSPLPDDLRADPVFDGDVLVLTGENDAFTPTSNFFEAGKGLTGATHRELSGAYHDTLLLGSESADLLLSWFDVDNLS